MSVRFDWAKNQDGSRRQVFSCDACNSGVLDIQLLQKHVATCIFKVCVVSFLCLMRRMRQQAGAAPMQESKGDGKKAVIAAARSPVFTARPTPKEEISKNTERLNHYIETLGGSVTIRHATQCEARFAIENYHSVLVGFVDGCSSVATAKEMAMGALCDKLDEWVKDHAESGDDLP